MKAIIWGEKMKKKILFLMIVVCFLMTGCFKYDSKDVLKDIQKKYENPKSYKLEGKLQIVNNEDTYNYDVSVLYQKKDKFQVSLKNEANNHEQIILKNSDGVYVLTPSLNKSFKFQSEWPYNNSQVYLLQSIVGDIKKDDKRDFVEKEDQYVFTTNVNYPNNRKLVKQVVTFDKKLNIKSVDIVDESDIPQMRMVFTSVDMSPTIDKNAFDLNSIMETVPQPTTKPSPSPSTTPSPSPSTSPSGSPAPSTSPSPSPTTPNSSQTGTLEDVIYPLYIPSGTKLVSQEKINKNDGERIILTFDGEKPFLLVEETASIEQEFSIIPMYGEPYLLIDTVGALSDNSVTWSSEGVDYYLVSDVMSQNELVDIARSINVIPTTK